MSVDEIIPKLTAAERRVVLRCGESFSRFPRAMGILAVNSCRNRYKLIEAEDAVRAIWNYRLTPLGLAVQGALCGVPSRP